MLLGQTPSAFPSPVGERFGEGVLRGESDVGETVGADVGVEVQFLDPPGMESETGPRRIDERKRRGARQREAIWNRRRPEVQTPGRVDGSDDVPDGGRLRIDGVV